MAFGVGTGDWGDDMPFGIDEEIDPDIVYCTICDEKMKDFYTTFFRDAVGRKRYGAICEDCRNQEKMDEAARKLFKAQGINPDEIKITLESDTTKCITGEPHKPVTKIHKYKLPKKMKWCEQCGAILMEDDGLISFPKRDK